MKLRSVAPPALWACVIGLGAMAGCSVSQPFPDKAAFTVDAGHPEHSAQRGGLALRVAPMRIAKPYDSQLFSYKIGPAQFSQDYYNGFVAPPDGLLGGQLLDWLNDSGAVRYAAAAGTTLDCNANLETQISELYADHTTNQAVIEMRVFLVVDDPGPTRVLMQKMYRETEPLPSQAPDVLVKAWSAAYRRMLTQLASDLAAVQLPASTKPAP